MNAFVSRCKGNFSLLNPTKGTLALLIATLLLNTVHGQQVWTGGGGDNNWTNAANWGGTAPIAGDALQFAGATRLGPTNDFAAETTFGGITFNSGAGAFTLTGNAITLGGNLTNVSSANQSVNIGLVLNGTRNITANGGAGLLIGGNISETGGSFGINIANGNVTLGGSNSFTGGVTVQNSTFTVTNSGALNTASPNALTFTGAAFAALQVKGLLVTVSSLSSATANSGSVWNASTLAPGTIMVQNNADCTFSGFFRNGASASDKALSLTKSGTAVLTLANTTASSVHSGATTIIQGTLRSGANNVLSDNSVVVLDPLVSSTATLDLSGRTDTIPGLTMGGANGATSEVQTGAGTLTVNGPVNFIATNNPQGASITGNLSLGSATRTYTVDDSSAATDDLTISAVVSGTGGLTKAGAGTLVLAAANTYSGTTTVSGGKLVLSGSGSLVSSMAVNLSGASASVDISGITPASVTWGSIAGVAGSSLVLGSKTLNVGGGTTFSGTTSGVGGGLTKTGTGTLTLNGASLNHTGNTLLSAGTLQVNNSTIASGSLQSSSGATITILGTSTFGGSVTNPTGGVIRLESGSTLRLQTGGTYVNDGSIAFNNNSDVTLRIVGDVTLSGAGSLTMQMYNHGNFIRGDAGTERLTNASGHTIQGQGYFGSNLMALTNSGTIIANQGNFLEMDPNAGGITNTSTGIMRGASGSNFGLTVKNGNLTNEGVIEATAGGRTTLDALTIDNTGGSIRTVGNGQLVVNGSTTSGGSLTNSSTGTIIVIGNNTFNGTLTNPAGGVVRLEPGSTLKLNGAGSFQNDGSVIFNNNADINLKVIGTVTLNGSGALTLVAYNSGNFISGEAGTDHLINSAGHTIQGQGFIGNNLMSLTNSGTIIANQGNWLEIDPNAGGINNTSSGIMRSAAGSSFGLRIKNGNLTNEGIIESTGGIKTSLEALTIANLSGIIRSVNGIVDIVGCTVTDGVLQASGTGSINLSNSTLTNTSITNSGSGSISTTGGTSTLTGLLTLTGSNSIIVGSSQVLNINSGLEKDAVTTTFSGSGTININTVGISGSSVTSDLASYVNTLNINVPCSYGGSTQVGAGTVRLNGAGALPVESPVIFPSNGTLNVSAISDSVTALGSLAGSTGAVVLGSKGIVIGGDNSSKSFSGTITGSGGSVTKIGSGTQTLSGTNSYNGVTTIAGGVVSVSSIGNGGVAGGIGQATSTAANLVFDGGTLQYTGASSSSNRSYTINPGKVAVWDITTNTLTLTGASAVTTGGLQKKGAGTLVLSGNNGHTGTTTVSEGTLTYGIANALSTGAVTVDGSTAILNLSTFSDSVGAVLVDNGGTISGSGTLTSTDGFELRSGTVSAPLAGSVALLKSGTGTAVLSGNNTYTGQTTVSEGTLTVNGNVANGSAATDVVVQSGAALNGSGVIAGAIGVSSGGTLAPGAGVGIMTAGAVALASSSTLSMQIEGDVPGTSHDKLNISGMVELGSANLVITGSHVPSAIASYTLIENDGADAVVGTFNGLPEGGILTINGVQKAISYVGGTGNDVVLSEPNYAPTAIALNPSSLAEKSSVGATVGVLTATDANTTDTHTFTLASGAGDADNGSFSIVSNELKIGIVANYEVKSSYSVRIKATDNRGADYEQSIQITITDINDAPTDIILSPSSLAENTVAPAVVGTLSATDEDAAASHMFTFVGGAGSTDNALFTISGGSLSLIESANFEVKSTYNVRVQADDGAGGIYEKALVVSITDVNEPATDLTLSHASVDENQPTNTAIGTLSATGDPETSQTHTFVLVSGTGDTDNASFNISGSTLQTSASFNFEQKSSYSIRVRATDSGSPAESFEKTFTISVNDVVEAVPTARYAGSALQFDGTSQWAEAPHIAAHLSPSFTVEAWVKTTATTGRIVVKPHLGGQRFAMSLVGGKADFRFDDGVGGFDRVESTALINDGSWHHIAGVFDNPNDSLKLYVDGVLNASAPATKEPQTSGSPLTIARFDSMFGEYLAGEIDEVRLWDRPVSASEITQNYRQRLTGSETGLVALYHFDEGSGSTLTDSSVSGNHAIVSGSATWALSGSGIARARTFFSSNLTLTLGGFDVDSPTTALRAIITALPVSGTLKQFGSLDPITTVPTELTDPSRRVVFVPVNGGEQTFSYQLTDGDATSAAAESVVVDVKSPPSITSSASVSVTENTASVTTITIEELNIGEVVTIAPDGGADANKFAIDSVSGALTFISARDFETPQDSDMDNVYEVNVTATDDGDPAQSVTQALTVTITNVNEAPTDITLSPSAIAENNAANATVGTLSAVDEDAGAMHSFSLVSGAGDTDNGAFSISGNTLNINSTTDFEVKNSYSIRVQATDDGSLIFVRQISVQIADIQLSQTIDFAALPDVLTDAAPITLSATASSGLPVSFSLVSGPAALMGNTLTLAGTPGQVTVRALQAGGVNDYNAATSVDRSFNVIQGNRAPVAVADSIRFNGASVIISPLANDTDADNDALTIVAVGTPAHGTVTFTANSITFTKKTTFTTSDTFSYTVEDPSGASSTATITVARYSLIAGSYSGLLDDGDGLADGHFRATIGTTGLASGRCVFRDRTVTFIQSLDSAGKLSLMAGTVPVSIEAFAAGASTIEPRQHIHITATNGAQVTTGRAIRHAYSASSPIPLASRGFYHVGLTALPGQPGLPSSQGWLRLRVGLDGTITASGRGPDALPVSGAVSLVVGDEAPLFLIGAKTLPRASLAGLLDVSLGGSVSGTCGFVRPAQTLPRGASYASPLAASYSVTGGKYVAPAAGVRILTTNGAGRLAATVTGGGYTLPASPGLTLTTSNTFTQVGSPLVLVRIMSNGILSGNVKSPTGTSLLFNGIAVPGLDGLAGTRATATFLNPTSTYFGGEIRMAAAP
ncbi:MAG: cadherin domain-containing protein [Verrucomicrobiaceae bacterium]|nr:cadherin domain-containing protein [Verrucomicrobiaceae bacterium]